MNPREIILEQQEVIVQVLNEGSRFYRATGRKPTTGTLGIKQARAFYPNDPTNTDIQIAGIRFRHDPTIEDGIKLDGEEPWSPTLQQPPKTAQDVLTEWNTKAPTFESLHDGHRSSHFFRSWMEATEPPKPRLFVWPSFSPDYSTGLAFAVATTEEQARQAIEQRLGFTPTEWGPVEIHDTTEPIAYARTGGG